VLLLLVLLLLVALAGGPLRRYVVGYAMFAGFAAGAAFAVQNSFGRLNGNKAQ
jgi:hypothetical protein